MIPIMKFADFSESFVDSPGLVSVTFNSVSCNLSCHGCHNRKILQDEHLPIFSREGFVAMLKRIADSLLVDVVIMSGGELTVYPMTDLVDLFQTVRDNVRGDQKIRIDTNGTNPEVVDRLVMMGLVDGVVMDVKVSEDLVYSDEARKVLGLKAPGAVQWYVERMEATGHLVERGLAEGRLNPDCSFFRSVHYPQYSDLQQADIARFVATEFPSVRHYTNAYYNFK